MSGDQHPLPGYKQAHKKNEEYESPAHRKPQDVRVANRDLSGGILEKASDDLFLEDGPDTRHAVH
jgi:hypothetical protein